MIFAKFLRIFAWEWAPLVHLVCVKRKLPGSRSARIGLLLCCPEDRSLNAKKPYVKAVASLRRSTQHNTQRRPSLEMAPPTA